MSVPRSVQITGTHVNAHTGDGDQYVFSLSLGKSAGRNPRKDPDADLRWLRQRFVYPSGFNDARGLLESDHRTVFLDGPPGSGRATAAKMLFWELRSDIARLYEIPLEEEENRPLDLDQISDGDGLWLDLSDIDARLWNEVHAELSALRERVLAHSGRLVVILPYEATDLAPQFEQFRVALGSPHAHEVFRRYMRMEHLPQPEDLTEIAFLGHHRSPGEVAAYVQRIMRIRAQSSGESDLASWIAAADEMSSGKDLQDVAGHVASLNRGSQRAFLLAAAMLDGTHADGISDAAETLLRQLGHPDDVPSLERPTLDNRLSDIRAEPDTSGVVTFSKIGYGAAVRRYLWTQLPHLREATRDWVAEIIDSAAITDDDRDRLVNRFLDQCLESRLTSMWAPLVAGWTRHPTRYRATAAALILRRGLQDEKNSRIFRRQIYWWSRDASIPVQLAEVIIAACRDEMALTHPEEALVRLHHLARREQRTSAKEALTRLVDGDPWLLRMMLSRLTGNRSAATRHAEADARLFLEFARPMSLTGPGMPGQPLISEDLIRGQLTDGWRLTFEKLMPDMWEARAADWLRCAAADASYREELLDVLVAAGGSHVDTLAYLFVISTRDTGMLAAISDPLLRKIDAVQGLQLEETS